MTSFIEHWLARLWNRRVGKRTAPADARALDLGALMAEGEARGRVTLPQAKRAEHIAVLGKTGTGKSSFIRHIAQQDIRERRGLLFFDLHGDSTDFLLRTVADEEHRSGENLSERLILIDPADPEYSVGMNPLESADGSARFVEVSEFAQVLRQRWHLDTFGARTDELLRNSLYVLAECGLTLVEIGPLLSHAGFRAGCLPKVANPDVRQYFELRYGQASDAMQATMREPILNKTSAFTADPHFRHIVGQRSTFSLVEAMDAGGWIIVSLHKGRLGEQAATLGAAIFTAVKNALFARRKRDLFTVYADEIQNFVAFGSDIETVLSEARKFGVSVVCANQYLDQYPPDMRAAVMAVGTHAFFQLASQDAQQIANALDGGKALAELLKNLPRRRMVVKSGHSPWRECVVPVLATPKADPTELALWSRERWARKRADIEAEIEARQAVAGRASREALNDWE